MKKQVSPLAEHNLVTMECTLMKMVCISVLEVFHVL
jgi:hypothetical protein